MDIYLNDNQITNVDELGNGIAKNNTIKHLELYL